MGILISAQNNHYKTTNMNRPLKCACPTQLPQPHYIIIRPRLGIGQLQYIIDFQEKVGLKSFLQKYLTNLSGPISIKIRDLYNEENPTEWTGKGTISQIINSIEKYDLGVFHDGYSQFMLRHSNDKETIVLDEHALLFITTKKDYKPLLKEFNIPLIQDLPFVMDYDHWHIRSPETEASLMGLIEELGLME